MAGSMTTKCWIATHLCLIAAIGSALPAQRLLAKQERAVPHNQEAPPGPALSPEEAMARMTVPDGFTVELVAAEPDIVNPVAMTFDHRGRIWVTESLEYPRLEAGPGRDRIKVLEDTTGDGRADRVTVFAEGLNIPSGIAVGYGGVWVANAPDLLFLQDTTGDGRADRSEVIVSGFGRRDSHELPNSLTWGPDGWLYGLNGVFNPSEVRQGDRAFQFTCAVWRVHPRTREFQLFAEGTSNPWGIAWDGQGSMFLSACVIDHLWHVVESGYYHRQAGSYPPFTWKIESIVDYKHQKAAYCGLHYFDSDAYPAEYRERLYMGNIHGGCINVDEVHRTGATYRGQANDDFLTANDAWFMPVSQQTGPDGCLYVLDWYDRYHCYQDARRDPQGIDRLKGRLYRIRYGDTPRIGRFDLAEASDEELIARLGDPNVYFRATAQRILAERNDAAVRGTLQSLVLDPAVPRKQRMHALWALLGGDALEPEFHLRLLASPESVLRAWGVRAAGNQRDVASPVRERVIELACDPEPDVRLQVAIAARKIVGVDPLPPLFEVLARCETDDPLLPRIVWQNLHPLLPDDGQRFVALASASDALSNSGVAALLPRAVERLLAAPHGLGPVATLVTRGLQSSGSRSLATTAACLATIAAKIETRELTAEQTGALRDDLQPHLAPYLATDSESPLHVPAALLAASWGDAAGLEAARTLVADDAQPAEVRLRGVAALRTADDPALLAAVASLLKEPDGASDKLRRQTLQALGPWNEPRVADVVLDAYHHLAAELQPVAIELLTGRAAWSKRLLAAIAEERIAAASLNVNQVRKLLASGDDELRDLVRATWGTLRTERDPTRERVLDEMRELIRSNLGDAHAGMKVFDKVCAQCHTIYGKGQEVGPDITLNGRGSFEQLLSNVFDPSLVIGAAYQARTVVTRDGRVMMGLVTEESPERVVLKVQGGKLETIARDDIDEMEVSRLSMMPEGLEQQLTPQEIADLFAFLSLDRPPTTRRQNACRVRRINAFSNRHGRRGLPMIVTVFRSRLRPEHAEEYARVAPRMLELARSMPGFVSVKSFAADDGERVTIVEFDSEASHRAWREHPEHLEAQRLGRDRFYSEYRVQVCRVERQRDFPSSTR